MAKKEKTSKVDEGYHDADSGNGAWTAEEVSEKYTVAELKIILKENGLKVSGKKQELVERALPILNGDLESTEEEAVEADDSGSTDADLPFNEDLLSSTLGIFGMDYEALAIKDKISMEDETNLSIQGFTQDGIIMSDSTMSIMVDSDSSNVDLQMNIPEVSYTDFESTIFTFKDLDLFILPSSDPQTLEFSAIMDSLEIMTEKNYVNLKGLNLFFKSFADEMGVRLDIDIDSFIYPDFNGTSINFEGLDFNLAIGLDGQKLALSVNLPKLTLLNKEYRVNLSDLNLNITVPDLSLSNLDLSILMSDFHYTNFDDVVIDMDNVDVSIEPINSNTVNVIVGMDGMDATGLDSFDELLPMMEITGVNLKSPADDSEPLIKLTGLMSLLDVTKLDLTALGALLGSGFDLDTYMGNMPDSGSFDGDVDAGVEIFGFDISGFDLTSIFTDCDYSSLDAIELNLTGLIDSTGIDLADFGVDMSGYDLSSISLSDLIGALGDSDFIKTSIAAVSKLFSIDFDNLDFSGLIAGFDKDKFDIPALLASLNLSDADIAAILEALGNMDLGSIFEGSDFSCFDAIVLDLTGLLDSIGIDLANLGIDLSGYDISAISVSDIIAILGSLDLDMSTLSALFKLIGIDIDGLDLSGLIAVFDTDNFDISTLLATLNLSDLDLGAIMEMFNDLDVDWEGIFENCDYSSLGAIELDLSGLLDSAGIDLSDFGIDLSDYDLSSISLSDLIGTISDSDFDMDTLVELDLSSIDFENIDMSGLVASFDTDNFDISSLLASFNLSDSDLGAILEMFANSDIDFAAIFENCDYSCLGAIELNLTVLLDSIGIDPADFGIDLSDYDLSSISLSDLIGILGSLEIDMSTLAALFKLIGVNIDDLDLSGLIALFDAENFDISSLLGSIKLFGIDLGAILEMFSNLDLEGIFKDFDYSCLDAIVLDLTGLLDSAGIDLADFGIDVSDYDLSSITLSELIGAVTNSEFIMGAVNAVMKLVNIDWDSLDFSGLVASFDAENFDMSSLLGSLNLPMDISGILEMFDANGFDWKEFMNNMLGMFMEETVAE
jgi:hypothetical protein